MFARRIAVIGTGYVGLTTGACLASLGHHVVCADIDPDKIDRLRQGEIDILEPGLPELVSEGVAAGRLQFREALAFLGARPEADVELIRPLISAQAGAAPPLSFGRVLLLPPRRARVLTVALDDPDGALAALQARVSAGLEQLGVYTPEKRAFRAHVTVARLRPRVQPPRSTELALEPLSFPGEAVTLFQSVLHPSGARYEPLATAALAAGWAGAAGGWPDELLKNLKKSESGRSRKRVSLLFNPFSYAVIER